MMRMTNLTTAMMAVVLLACFASCNRWGSDDPAMEGIPTTLQLQTRGDGDTEFEVSSLRVMLFRSTGEPLSNELFTGVSITDPITIQTTTGERVLVLVANESASLTARLLGYRTLSQVGGAVMDAPYTQGNLLPFTYRTNLTVKEVGNAPVAAKLERVVSKTALCIGKSDELAAVEVKLLAVQIRQAANGSWLLPHTGGDWVAAGGDTSPLADLPAISFAADNVLAVATPKTIAFDRYLYEYNAGEAKEQATALYIKILNNGVEKEYTLPFFFFDKEGYQTYGVARNTYFTIEATVYPKGIRIEKYTVDGWDKEAPWDKDEIKPGGDDGNTSVEGWIDDDGWIAIDGLT